MDKRLDVACTRIVRFSVSHFFLSGSVMVLGVAGLLGLWSLINYSGLVMFSVYADCDPLTAGYIDKMDQVNRCAGDGGL